MNDAPLEPLEGRFATVVDIGEFRVRHGRTPYKAEKTLCRHLHLIVSQSERRVWCEDCQKTIEPMDAVISFFNQWSQMEEHYRYLHSKVSDGLSATLNRRASKAVDKVWGGGNAISCPHCHKGILPEDIGDCVPSWSSREYEIARRKAATEPKPKDPAHD